MKSALLIIGSMLIGLAISALAFVGTGVFVGYLYLSLNKAAAHDGQGGIPALICGALAGVPAALCAGYFWLQYCLNRFLKMGMIPAVNK